MEEASQNDNPYGKGGISDMEISQALQMNVAAKTRFLLSSWRNRRDGPLGLAKQTSGHDTQFARQCDGALK
ncbi:hypothetical protein I79_017471 [Cricetulus griseus]|uniref:Uncharacterized protein n=1 Tax=Cricetulus griseus TaxID=10029 RepID=G3I235_CRIGR|nr:hypothetical protein I79_017471 [Cricetulus griseus]